MSLEEYRDGDDETMLEVMEIEKLEQRIKEKELRNERKRKLIDTIKKLDEEGDELDETVSWITIIKFKI